MPSNLRPTLHEGGATTPLSRMEETTGVEVGRVRHLIEERSARVRTEFSLRADPFAFEGSAVATRGVAGILRLAPDFELEIVPKCFAPDNPDWRDDFLTMATVTRLGRIFRKERVSASRRTRHADLLSLLAAIFLDEFERLIRVPIRDYRPISWTDLDIDGELDYGEIWEPRSGGFPQTGSRLSADNSFMGAISEAAAYLGTVSIDRGVGQRLQRLASLFRNPARGRARARVPGRHARWQDLYSLAHDVLAGHGMELAPEGALRAPGFLLNTERCWEDLIALALVTRGGQLRAQVKPRLTLGTRYLGNGAVEGRRVSATPDVVLNPPLPAGAIVIDAKYKGSSLNPTKTIDRDDLFEALGFLTAAGSNVAILIYPGGDRLVGSTETGAVTIFDEVVIGSRRVIGATVSTRGIGRADGLAAFGRMLGQSLLDIASRDVPALRAPSEA